MLTCLLIVGALCSAPSTPAPLVVPPADAIGKGSLNIRDAVLLALTRNRELIAARLQINVAEIEQVAASLISNPEISYSLDNIVLGKGNDQGVGLEPPPFSQNNQGVEISQALDIWFKRSLRREAASAGYQEARLQVEDAVREVRFAVQSAFAEVLREQWESELATQARQRYDSTVALTRKRFEAGEISETDLRKIELEELKYINTEIDAQMQLAISRQRLATLLAYESGDALPPKLEDEAAQGERPALDAGQLLRRALEERPDLQAAQAGLKESELTLRSEERDAFPDLSLSLGYTHSYFQVSGDNPHTLGLGLSFELPVFSRNQAGIGLALVERRRADNQVEQVRLAVRQDVAEAYRKLTRSRAMLDIFEKDMLQRADQALAVAEKSFRAGAVSLLEILEAQRTYIETRANYLETLYDWRQGLIDMAHAVGSDFI